ncbi:MAG: tetratricopeptide repeat protein [Treponema sp.]|uniref:tetratricopeptide repeat protein n=1 Tax=Treponema sp. TaxID=166 RepID=UPI001B6D3D79|nr:tetratricopeptide repeat protein [Treponema sp.]MBP3773686.1 tetratricopeptide repeat protein [Treponema sp.]MBQ9282011.1 tetratricopeptide repeat protein [Treponema sp.]
MVENVVSLNTQAIELASSGQYREAIACLQRAISIEKYNHLLWYNLGITYRDAGNLEAAKSALVHAHEINDEDDEIIETLALVCFNQGCKEEALAFCLEGLSNNSENSHLWNTLGVLYFNENDFPMACEAFENAVTINPYYYDALFNLRDTYEELGNKAGYQMCVEQMKNIQLGENDFKNEGGNA